MAGRSLTATPDGIRQINRALTEEGWSREDLAKKCDCSRQPAVKFCAGQAVSNKLFVSFCKALGLDWEEIAGLKSAHVTAETIESETDIDALVQTIRAQVHGDIQARCGTMRVLDMEQPIGLGDIYTSVNILEKLSGRRRLGLDELLQDCDLENFDRFLLGQVRHRRVPGLEAVEEHSQLMILGKPGAGKTTFMKRLAILCNQGEFQPQRVPVFVTLKDYAEAEGKPNLEAYIQRQWNACGVEAVDALSTVLGSGKALVLLDGLDEVYETDHDRVLQDIKTFAHQFRTCQCVITCRIAAKEYTFEQFTEVEVADFDQEQIAEFSTKWFRAKNDSKKAETFIQRLEDNKPIQELATNPLLLTLLCLVFGEAADFPANRAELYKEGLDVLLKKWDSKRNIERDQVYKKLSLKRKEDLLSQLAFETFQRGDYFFKQATVESHIIQYIRNLPGACEDDEALQLDCESILKSIEAQHGLLVERARKIYSFSHLTFHEYFTAKHIVNPDQGFNERICVLARMATQKRWREIILIVSEMIYPADEFIFKIRNGVDLFAQRNPNLLGILNCIQEKATSNPSQLPPKTIRSFYLSCIQSRGVAYMPDGDLTFLARNILGLEDFALDYPPFVTANSQLNYEYSVFDDSRLDEDLIIAHALSHIARLLPMVDSFIKGKNNFSLSPNKGICQGIERACVAAKKRNFCILNSLEMLKDSIPAKNGQNAFKDWWESNKLAWEKDFKAVFYEFYGFKSDIVIPLFVTKVTDDSIRQYSEAVGLVHECLNGDVYISKSTRQYIEDTLLLPLSEIEKYPVPDAIANL